MQFNPNGYPMLSVDDLALAEEKGYLTKAEARAVLVDMLPTVKRIEEAKALIRESS